MERTKATTGEPVKKIARLVCDHPIPELPISSGILLSCGQGDMGQLGLGEDQMERKRPSQVNDIPDVVDICAGGMHSLCLTKTGVIYSFGCNDEGALGRDSSEEGSDFVPKSIELPGKCVKISAGDSHSACLLADGRVFAWGSFRDSHGNMGLTLEGNKRMPIEVLPGTISCDIASGADHLVILTCSGRVFTMGCAEQGQLGRVSLRTASGESRRGKIELLQPGKINVKRGKLIDAIWATTYCTFVREMNTPNIYAFGLNNYNQLGLKQTSELIIAPTLTKFENVKSISGGQHHTLVLTEDNKCFAIGRKEYGRLGLGNIANDVEKLTLIKSLEDKNVINISCGEAQSFAVTSDGKLYAWGMGSNLQLGTGNEDDEMEPVHIVSKQTQDKKVLSASSGGQHSLFLVEKENSTPNGDSKTVLKDKLVKAEKVSGDSEKTKINGEKVQSNVDESTIQSKDVSSSNRGRKRKN